MLIPIGIFASSGSAAPAVQSFDLLESTVLTGNQASVSFTNLASKYAATYQHLQLRVVVRDTFTGGDGSTVLMRFNGDAGNNYSFHFLEGNGSSVLSKNGVSTNRILFQQSSNGNWSADVIDILDPFETTKNKTTRILCGAPTVPYVGLLSGNWRNTAQITSILLQTEGFNLAQGSRFSLYGIKATA
jgi:hypothetical protein